MDGAFVQHFDGCVLDVVAPGTTTVLLISSVISCSENIEFRNVIVSWSQNTGGCGVPPESQERGAKCWMPPGSIFINDPPVAKDDTATTTEDAPVAIDVVGNDFDVDRNLDATAVTVILLPLHGLTAVDPLTGVVTYTPDSNFDGADTFSYQVCDSDGACDTALVTIIVEPVDDPPVANPDTVVTLEDTPVVINVVANDYDVDGDLDSTTVTVLPTNGTVLVDPETGDATYLPYANVAGEDTFVYQVCDTDGMCDTATVEVFVEAANDVPIVSDLDVVTFEDTPIELLVEAEDPEGEFLVFMVPIPPVYGTVSELDVLVGKLTYVPEPGFAGADSFILQVCDASGGCSIAWVNVEVVEVNDPPDAICLNRTVSSGVPEEIELVGVDTDGDVLTYRIVKQPRYGSVPEIDAETGMISYVSEPAYTGPDWSVFEVCDSFGAYDRCMIQLLVVFAAGGAGVAGECGAPIIISEVAWAGTAADPAHEWIELRNLSDERVDLEDWTLRWRRKQPETREDELWRAIRLEGIVESEAVKEGTRGYFLLERSIDDVVKDIPAAFIYAGWLPLGLLLELPNAGAVLELVDPYGFIADAANADHPERDGWAAGDRIVLPTMERTDPDGPDVDRNWHTKNGLFVRGLDAFGNPVIGTPRNVNSRPIVE